MNNNSIKFKNKYLKYKHKYIILKDQIFFTYDTKIKQLGGMGDHICIPNVHGLFESFDQCQASSEVVHIKSIFPRDIPRMNNSINYEEYVTHFLDYLDSESAQLKDLWMIIGATNVTNPSCKEWCAYDLTRFGDEYDIAITQGTFIDVEQPKLLALYSYGPTETPELYRKKATIYELLAEKLPNKFSKIIYDEGTTKFVLENDKIFNELTEIEKLIELNGKLYINTFRKAFKILSLTFDATKNVYNLISSSYNDETRTSSKTIVTPDMSYIYLEYNKIQIQFYSNDYIIIIYNPKALFTYMDLEGSISKDLILSHLKEMDKHKEIDNQDHYNKTVEKLKLIFSPNKYKIEYITDIRYPNNQIKANTKDFREKFGFYVIERIT